MAFQTKSPKVKTIWLPVTPSTAFTKNSLVRLTSGKLTNLIAAQGGAARPQISPDGKFMAYVKRVRLKSVLFVQNIKTEEDYVRVLQRFFLSRNR